MKLKYVAGVVGMLCLAGTAHADSFFNGGFESGTTGGWTTGGGYRALIGNNDLTPSQFLPGGSLYSDGGSRGAVIDSSYVDPHLGSLIGSTIYSGSYAYRAEDTSTGGYGTAISQKVNNYTDSQIVFAWKAVLENGGHEENDSAVMKLTLVDDTTGQLLVSRTYNAGYSGSGVDSRFLNDTNTGLFYTPTWQVETLSINSSLSGHSFTLSLLAADCSPTAHTGYAYLDGFGAALPVPEPETYGMLLAGLGLVGVVARRKKSA